ncbi:MAG: hypothetical protein ACRCVN_00730 [Spirochaetia bacterium]
MFVMVGPQLFAQQGYQSETQLLSGARLAENYEVRQQLEKILLLQDFEETKTPTGFFRQKSSPYAVSLSVYKASLTYFIQFINNVPYADDRLARTQRYTRGSYLFEKSLTTNEFVSVKIFIQDNQDTYILIKPQDAYRSRMSLVIYGQEFYTNVPVPMGMRAVSISPLAKLMGVTRYQIDWDSIFQPSAYPEWQETRWMINQARPHLKTVGFNNDGALNANGELVFIETQELQPDQGPRGLNCSGFVKWIIDGLYQPLSEFGTLLPIAPLKVEGERQVENRWNEQYNSRRDPYFGLDWVRNLAYLLRRTQRPEALVNLYSEDVRNANFTPFYKDIGYPLEKVESVLYELAIKNPGQFFLGSISTEFGRNPVLRQHRHVAAFFPYFDDYGNFRISILDVGEEKKPKQMIKDFPTGFVYFIRVATSRNFKLPVVPTQPGTPLHIAENLQDIESDYIMVHTRSHEGPLR